jgi:hypothetical protein
VPLLSGLSKKNSVSFSRDISVQGKGYGPHVQSSQPTVGLVVSELGKIVLFELTTNLLVD